MLLNGMFIGKGGDELSRLKLDSFCFILRYPIYMLQVLKEFRARVRDKMHFASQTVQWNKTMQIQNRSLDRKNVRFCHSNLWGAGCQWILHFHLVITFISQSYATCGWECSQLPLFFPCNLLAITPLAQNWWKCSFGARLHSASTMAHWDAKWYKSFITRCSLMAALRGR